MGLIHICIIAVSLYSHHADIEVHKLKLGENNAEARTGITSIEQLKSDLLGRILGTAAVSYTCTYP